LFDQQSLLYVVSMVSFIKNQKFKSFFIYLVVAIISLLLFINIILISNNNDVIEYNKRLTEETEKVKLNTLDIVRNGHQLDMSLRGLALVDSKRTQDVFENAFFHKEEIFDSLEAILKSQKFPMEKFANLRDSMNEYFQFAKEMRELLKQQKQQEFLSKLEEDRGYFAWIAYRNFSREITAFENKISAEAQFRYKQALRKATWLQIILFIIAVPTLLYTAFFATKVLAISERLGKAEHEKNQILARQKEELEYQVKERTNEILLQNEEITAQNEEMATHNERLIHQQNEIEQQHKELSEQNLKLKEAHRIIEEQNQTIQRKNEELLAEVIHQTQDLRKTNGELIEHNSRLEQFAFIISHNLRAPMARLVGLSSVLNLTKEEKDKENIVNLMVRSTSELDGVIKDLSLILGIQKLNTKVYSEINLYSLVQKIKTMLEQDINEINVQLTTDLHVTTIYSLPQYLESIFYNLISNSIKYRNPVNPLSIKVKSYLQGKLVILEFSDNGLGIDLEKYRHSLFNLYKRFHFHVEGKGLGLYLVKTQVEALGGKIEVESKINEGTVFRVSIPFQ